MDITQELSLIIMHVYILFLHTGALENIYMIGEYNTNIWCWYEWSHNQTSMN